MKTTKVCREPGCPNLEPCDTHPRKAWGNTNGTTSRQRRGVKGSGWEEQARNQATLRKHRAICHVCGLGGATQVDHVTPLFENGTDTEDNRRPIHPTPCHANKTKAEQARARNPRGYTPTP